MTPPFYLLAIHADRLTLTLTLTLTRILLSTMYRLLPILLGPDQRSLVVDLFRGIVSEKTLKGGTREKKIKKKKDQTDKLRHTHTGMCGMRFCLHVSVRICMHVYMVPDYGCVYLSIDVYYNPAG